MSDDLEEIIERAFFEAFNNGKSTKGVISKAIKDAGYCKFPVGELEKWLNKCSLANAGVFLDKIKELEDGT